MAVLSSNTPTALCVTNTTMEKDALTTVGPGMMLLDTFTVEKREKRFATLAGRDNTAQNQSVFLDVMSIMVIVRSRGSANAV